jgi:hypothetical protein
LRTLRISGPLLMILACSSSKSPSGAISERPLAPLDASLLEAANKSLAAARESANVQVKNAVLSSELEIRQFGEKLKSGGPATDNWILKPYPVAQDTYDYLIWYAAGMKKCGPKLSKEIYNWLARWEAYHSKEDPACAIDQQYEAALQAGARWGALCKLDEKTASGDFSKCLMTYEEAFVCDQAETAAWGAVRSELPRHLHCK